MGLIRGGYIIRKCNQAQARRDAITNANCARILAGWKACEAAKEPELEVIPSLGQMIHEIEEKKKRRLEETRKKEENEKQAKIREEEWRKERSRIEAKIPARQTWRELWEAMCAYEEELAAEAEAAAARERTSTI